VRHASRRTERLIDEPTAFLRRSGILRRYLKHSLMRFLSYGSPRFPTPAFGILSLPVNGGAAVPQASGVEPVTSIVVSAPSQLIAILVSAYLLIIHVAATSLEARSDPVRV
jgi:hypothetical protein